MPVEKYKEIIYQFVKIPEPKVASNSKNIVYIYLEGLSRNFTVNEKFPNLTPNIRNLNHKIEWTNIDPYSTAITIEGLFGSQCAFPLNFFSKFETEREAMKTQKIICATEILKNQGYYTYFMKGFDLNFQNTAGFLQSRKYDEMIGKDKLLKRGAKNTSEWGVYDDEMFDLVHEMRTRIIKSPSFTGEKIIGAILFEKTIERKIDDKFTADYLWEEKGIVPFLKVDKGLQPEANGVQLMKDIPTLDELLKKGIEKHIFGTKMRSVIKSANEEGIKAIVAQQFDIAKKILSYGLIPIIEPEVDIHSVDKEKCEEILKKEIFANLDKLDKDQKIMLKLTIPSVEGFYSDVIAHDNVLRVVALSGGYTRVDSNEKLAKNPGLIASFSRALTEGLNVDQTQKEFDDLLEESIDGIYQASIK